MADNYDEEQVREHHREDSQESAMTIMEKAEAVEKERKASEDEWIKSMEKHPRCAILPSPEKLKILIGSSGSDETDTLNDFDLIKDWVTKSQLLNAGFYGTVEERYLSDDLYYSFIHLAFCAVSAAIRHTASPDLEELVFWYYAGHGLSKEEAQNLPYSSTPCLTNRIDLDPTYYAVANNFVKENRKVKGGELCLHEDGFCDLYGLLKPWIAAVKAPSINADGCKKNKHLVIILDSCYSGIIAQELKDFEKEMNEKDPTFLNENSVTVQAACGSEQHALGGYFTPCFVYLNDPKNAKLLNDLKGEWVKMTEERKNEYKSIELPSPFVVTTRPQSRDVTMEVTIQNFNLTLFQDPGFFKFCSIKVYQHQDESLFDGKDRVLDFNSANDFMNSQPFAVLDYKLKKQVTGPYAESPMGLFLLEDHQNAGYAVCAHIHFEKGNTGNHQKINLVHHKIPPVGSVLYLEDHDGLTVEHDRK